MTGFLNKGVAWCFFLVAVVCLTGCSEPEQEKASLFLIKTPLITITNGDFLEKLDLKRAAYPYNIDENPAEYNEMVIHLVEMLSEEIVLLSAAVDKAVILTDQEVQSAEDEFKKDYPDDSFEQMMIKNAVSYSFWKKGFKENMIIEKVIDQELTQKIEITSEDMIEFYKRHTTAEPGDSENKTMVLNKIENEIELISRLRTEKTQEQYDDWIQQLRKDYPVEINMEKLKTFLIDGEESGGSKDEKEN